MSSTTSEGSSRLSRLIATAKAVADADPDQIEQAAHRLGQSRRYLAPIAWAAGALVLLVRGIKLLFLNWRLTVVEFIPAIWVWIVMWDLRRHSLRADVLRDGTPGQVSVLLLVAIAASTAAFWCNTVFGFAVSDEKARILPAARRAQPHLRSIVVAGVVLGVVLTLGALVIPRSNSLIVTLAAMGIVYSVMLIGFVAVPARLLGAKKQRRSPKEAIGSWTIGGALSAVAMAPGFLLDRIGLVLMGVPGMSILGFILLSIGTGLYAAGMSSVKAVKLSMKLDTSEDDPSSG